VQRGEVWLFSLDATAGHEQQAARPVAVVDAAEVSRPPRLMPLPTGHGGG